jgi:formylglycine-generating enzyme required for sulfatase activity
VVFDASTSVDKESPLSKLSFRWDFDGDGVFETGSGPDPRVGYTYTKPGKYQPRAEVADENKGTGTATRTINVRDRCPVGMVSVVDDQGHSFCIDKYEYPNGQGRRPGAGVSWVEAKMTCVDAGKRLCTRREWEAVCRFGSENAYPYGDAYDRKQCPTEGKEPWASGSFKRCGAAGAYDMVGNLWEWVEDKQGDYPVMVGGSYHDGKDAHCGLSIPSTLAARAGDVGFRCCK